MSAKGWRKRQIMKIPMKKTHCSYCGSESITEVQYDENFENFKAASKYAWVGLTLEDLPNEWISVSAFLEGARWAEKSLREKNT